MDKKKKAFLLGVLTTTALVTLGAGLYVWTTKNIPYSYSQNALDIIDYIAGKNVFGRADSLQ